MVQSSSANNQIIEFRKVRNKKPRRRESRRGHINATEVGRGMVARGLLERFHNCIAMCYTMAVEDIDGETINYKCDSKTKPVDGPIRSREQNGLGAGGETAPHQR